MNKPTIKEVEEWVMTLYNTCEETITDAERREQHKYATMVQRPQDKKFLVKMLDESSQDLGARGDYNSTIGSYYSEALDADYSCTIYAYLYELENAFLGSGYDCITWNTADMTGIENVTTPAPPRPATSTTSVAGSCQQYQPRRVYTYATERNT